MKYAEVVSGGESMIMVLFISRGQHATIYMTKCTSNRWTMVREVDKSWKIVFLQLAADSVEDVNGEVDCDNILYARKAMLGCGLALGFDEFWSIGQLFPHLQEIIVKHLQYFQGQELSNFNRAD